MDNNNIFINNKNGREYLYEQVVTDTTNSRDGLMLVLYSDAETGKKYVRDVTEFNEKFTQKLKPETTNPKVTLILDDIDYTFLNAVGNAIKGPFLEADNAKINNQIQDKGVCVIVSEDPFTSKIDLQEIKYVVRKFGFSRTQRNKVSVDLEMIDPTYVTPTKTIFNLHQNGLVKLNIHRSAEGYALRISASSPAEPMSPPPPPPRPKCRTISKGSN